MTHTQKRILVVLALHSSPDYFGNLWPGYAELEKETGRTRAQLRRAFKAWEAEGLASYEPICHPDGDGTWGSGWFLRDALWLECSAHVERMENRLFGQRIAYALDR